MGGPADVSAQYAADALVARIGEALTLAGLDGRVDWQDLILIDHFHSRWYAASSELAAALAPERGDHVWTQHAAMNIAERDRLYAEIHRVLRPNGRFAIHDVVAGDVATLHFRVPWAATADVNFLLTATELNNALTAAGFDIASCDDKTAVTLEGPPPPSPHPALGSFVLAGPDYPNAVQTFLRNLREGHAGVVEAIVTRR